MVLAREIEAEDLREKYVALLTAEAFARDDDDDDGVMVLAGVSWSSDARSGLRVVCRSCHGRATVVREVVDVVRDVSTPVLRPESFASMTEADDAEPFDLNQCLAPLTPFTRTVATARYASLPDPEWDF